jgi:thiosulfate/3-mercaptopyruvate sulfurtransferase
LHLGEVREAVYRIPEFEYRNWISTEEVKLAIEDRSNRILDVRTSEEYSGVWFTEGPPINGQRTGRIPNSEHIPHDLFLNSVGQIDESKVLKIVREYGLSEKNNYICYCAAGIRSALSWFVLKELVGFPSVRNYSGSWLEWSADNSTPVVV